MRPSTGAATWPTPGEPQLVRGEQLFVIEMKQASENVSATRVNQLEHNGEEWVPLVGRVVSSIMLPDPREHVKAWCWELALETKSVYLVDPIRFSFVAVPGHPGAATGKVPRPKSRNRIMKIQPRQPHAMYRPQYCWAWQRGHGSIEPRRHPVSRSQ